MKGEFPRPPPKKKDAWNSYRESYWQARHEQLADLVAGIVVLLSWIKV